MSNNQPAPPLPHPHILPLLVWLGCCVSFHHQHRPSSSQLLAEFTRLPLPCLKGIFDIHELVQLPADAGHVELGCLALLPQGGRLHPQLRGGHGKLLAAFAALHLHPFRIVQEGLHAHRHWIALVLRHFLDRDIGATVRIQWEMYRVSRLESFTAFTTYTLIKMGVIY